MQRVGVWRAANYFIAAADVSFEERASLLKLTGLFLSAGFFFGLRA